MKKRTERTLWLLAGFLILGILYTLKNTGYFARAATFVFSVFLFYLTDIFLKLKFKTYHYFLFLTISSFGILFSPLYWMFPPYDKILHFLSPILICMIVYYLVDKIDNLNFIKKLYLTIAITISFLAFWELAEFSLDKFYDLKLQGVWLKDVTGATKINLLMNRNDDTMIDLLLGVLGSIAFVIGKTITFYYNKLQISKKLKNI